MDSQSSSDNPTRTKEEIDSFLAQSMNQLSVQEREAAYEELHGIASSNPETPERVSEWLTGLDDYLKTIKTGSTYEVAEAMDRSYVTSEKFRMMFLRADRYDVKKAAHRMLKFMDIKKSLFGVAKLTQKITLEDLVDDDLACLKSGSLQIPPVRDIAGRPIVVGMPCLRQYKSIDSELRARYYLVMSLVESEEAQLSGAIGIWYTVAPNNNNRSHPASSAESRWRHGSNPGLLWNLPIRLAAGHFCCDNFWYYVLASPVIFLSKSAHKLRVHYGKHEKCLEALGTFGIPRRGIPLNDQMETCLNNHEQWLASRKEKETKMAAGSMETRSKSPSAIEVRPEDVLFGRGKRVDQHQGNVHLRKLIASHQDAYDRASTVTEKTEMARRIAEQIQCRGGRFLKQDGDDEWKEASTKESRAKITMAFRSQRKNKRG